jgi:hypothetical protein
MNIFKRKKKTVIASPKEIENAPGSLAITLQQKIAVDQQQKESELTAWEEKEKEWRSERNVLRGMIENLKRRQEESEIKHEAVVDRLVAEIQVERACMKMKLNELADTVVQRDELQEELNNLKMKLGAKEEKSEEEIKEVSVVSERISNEDSIIGTISTNTSSNFSWGFDDQEDLYERELQAHVEEAAQYLGLEDNVKSEIKRESFFLRRFMEDVPSMEIVATMLYKLAQERMLFEWNVVEEMWSDIDTFKIRQLYRLANNGFNGSPNKPFEVASRMRVRERPEENN